MRDSTSHALNGVTVIVTRASHQADGLAEKITQMGGRAIRYPVLAIAAPVDLTAVMGVIKRLSTFHIAIFISANAVDQAMALLPTDHLPTHLKVAAVGKATATALINHGEQVDIEPDGQYNTEALLSHPDLQSVLGRNVVIFRGEGGRELLASTLSERGANVEYAECYRRSVPTQPGGRSLLQLLEQQRNPGQIEVVTVTSNQALQNLYEMVGTAGRHWLQSTPIIGVSERIKALAAQLGMTNTPIITSTVSDDAIVEAIIANKALWKPAKV